MPDAPTNDWTNQVTDAVERVVGSLRDRTVTPVRRITRAIVYGLLSAFFLLTAGALFAIGMFRVLCIVTGEAWIAHAIVGGLFVTAGALCWSRRHAKAAPAPSEGLRTR